MDFLNGVAVEVVIMVVANKYNIDLGEFIDLTSWGSISFRKFFLSENGINKEVIGSYLNDSRRMTYPRVPDILLGLFLEVCW